MTKNQQVLTVRIRPMRIEDLEQVYTDIRLANSLAWLSSEFSRRTPSLNENYMRLRTNIVERLERVKQQMEQETGGK